MATRRGRSRHKKNAASKRSGRGDDGSVALLLVLGFLVWFFFIRTEAAGVPSEYSEQVEVLVQSEVALKNLATFISKQRALLEEQEEYVAALGEEADGLRLFIDTERPKVQAVLDAQARKYRTDRLWELGASFVVGIIASLVAQLLYRRISRSAAPPPGEPTA